MTEDKYSSKTLNVEAFILFKIKNKKKHITYSQKKKMTNYHQRNLKQNIKSKKISS